MDTWGAWISVRTDLVIVLAPTTPRRLEDQGAHAQSCMHSYAQGGTRDEEQPEFH
jgi:hypothetical protein